MDNKCLLYFTDTDGKVKHICPDFLPKVEGAKTISDLIRLYKREPSWALSVHYPSFEVMQSMFKNWETRRNGVYVDWTVDTLCDDQIYIFNKCRGRIRVEFNPRKACFPILYMGLGCEMDVHIDGTYCEINIYDGGTLNITTAHKGKVVVYNYGYAEIRYSDTKNVIIRDKHE